MKTKKKKKEIQTKLNRYVFEGINVYINNLSVFSVA